MISYTPSSPTTTLFSQRAHISSPPTGFPPYEASQGDGIPLSKGVQKILKRVGGKLEDSSVDRFAENAEKGRVGFTGVLDEVARVMREKKEAQGTFSQPSGI
jgi:hypothetical protein